MKFKLILFLIFGMVFINLVNAYICQDETDVDDIPCEALTPNLNCSIYDYNVSTPAGVQYYYGNLTAISDGTYNFTFNETAKGSYSIRVCNHTVTSSLEIVDVDEEDDKIWLYIVYLLITFTIICFGWMMEDHLFHMFGGFSLINFGVYVFQRGLSFFANNLLETGVAWIALGLGAYFIIDSGIKIAEEVF